ncbi:MAG TPA: hypothetical protein VH597_00290 [Verrucomicrobiae bacterium]|jgi:hypothetical protein|nr:hypothetical protein [Verrucomicrobiae bacterium]
MKSKQTLSANYTNSHECTNRTNQLAAICVIRVKPFWLFLWTLAFGFGTLSVPATPFFIQGFQSDSPALTSQIGVSYWPPSDHPFTIYGTNIIYGGNIVTITPNGSGYSSNWLYPGTYRFYFTNLNAAFVANIPDTTNFNSLALYVTNVLGFSGVGLNSYGVITNLLGLAPATNSVAGIEAALGYVPATNNNSGIAFGLGFAPATNNNPGITSALGFIPATNSNSGIVVGLGFTPATNTYNGIANSLGFAPATNNFVGSTNALGYMPATNSSAGINFALGFTPTTNTYGGITNSLGFAPATNSTAGLVATLGYIPATNSYSGLTNSLGFAPATNSTTGIVAALHYTPRTNDGYIGTLTGAANLATNGFIVWVSYKTNGVPDTAFTNLPAGSLLTTTNGQLFVLSNLVWQAK